MQQFRRFLRLIDLLDFLLQSNQPALFGILKHRSIVDLGKVVQELMDTIITVFFTAVFKRQIADQMKIPVKVLIVLTLQIHYNLCIIDLADLRTRPVTAHVHHAGAFRMINARVVPLAHNSVFLQNTGINQAAVAAVIIVRLQMLHLQKHTLGRTVPHMTVAGLVHRVINPQHIARFFCQRMAPVFPCALKPVLLHKRDQTVGICLVTDAVI